MCTAYRVDGLPFGEHTVTIEVSQGSLAIDAVAVLGEAYRVKKYIFHLRQEQKIIYQKKNYQKI